MSNPFADPESLLRYGLRVKDVRETQKRTPERPSSPRNIGTVVTGQGLIHDGSSYVFESLEIGPGRYAHIALNTELLSGNNDQPGWWSLAQTTPGVLLPNGVVQYQMMYRLFSLRNNAVMNEVRDGALAVLREDWTKNYPHLGTRIDYVPTTLEATIQHLQLDKTVLPVRLKIPEFVVEKDAPAWSYFVLAKPQPEDKLGKNESLSAEALSVLNGLLGAHADEAGAVCQYVSPRKDGKLREARLWVPSAQNRSPRALVLGVSNDDVRFGIDADSSISYDWPARGVVVREKFSK